VIVKKVRGVIVSFPSKEIMDEILKEANVKQYKHLYWEPSFLFLVEN